MNCTVARCEWVTCEQNTKKRGHGDHQLVIGDSKVHAKLLRFICLIYNE